MPQKCSKRFQTLTFFWVVVKKITQILELSLFVPNSYSKPTQANYKMTKVLQFLCVDSPKELNRNINQALTGVNHPGFRLKMKIWLQ